MRHVGINDVWYDLAETAEGVHYTLTAEPLRPPNAQIVQGDSQDFQLRPDLLQWSLTGWQGGEGILKWSAERSDSHYILQGVDPFTRPGMLQAGFAESIAQDSTGASDLAVSGLILGKGRDSIWALAQGSAVAYEWDKTNRNFKASVATGGAIGTSGGGITGDADYLFYLDTSANIRRFDGTTWALHNDQCTATSYGTIAVMGDYVYYLADAEGALYEVSRATANTTTPEVALYEMPTGDTGRYAHNLVVGDGRLYLYQSDQYRVTVHEIVPSSAAGAGYGRVLAVIEGVHADAIWFQSGLVYLLVADSFPTASTSVGPDRQVFYIDPNGSYGTLGSVRGLVTSPSDHGIARASAVSGYGSYASGGHLSKTAFLCPPTSEDQDVDDVAQGIFEVNGVTGGFAAVGRFPTSITAFPAAGFSGLEYIDGVYFTYDDTADRVVIWETDKFTTQVGEAVSAYHDFNLASEKILERIEVSCEPLPAGTDITVGYQLDDGTWVDTSFVSTTAATGGELVVSTDTATKVFRSMKIRVKITAAGSPVASPVVKSVDVFARVNRHIKVWDLLLDVSDSTTPTGQSGGIMIDNIQGIAENTVIPFVDKYSSRNEQFTGDEYDVVVDSYSIIASQPGEGVIAIRLIEVG